LMMIALGRVCVTAVTVWTVGVIPALLMILRAKLEYAQPQPSPSVYAN
jgi:hypothetical protein